MISLDDTKIYHKSQDDERVLLSINSLPDQLLQSFTEIRETDYSADLKKINKILVCGMGGSRFPSLIIQNLFKEELPVPYLVSDDYRLPGYVDEKTLVVLSSYSGTTEETINALEKATTRKAKIFVIASGGKLKEMAIKNKYAGYYFEPKHNPSQQPRIGVGYLLGSHLGLLVKLGILVEYEKGIENAIKNLTKFLSLLDTNKKADLNLAKKTAEQIYGHFPQYIVSEFLTGVGNAISNQTNETAKSIASFWVIPELNHHLMEGLKNPAPFKKNALFVFIYSSLYSKPIKKRFIVTKEVIDQYRIKNLWVEVPGKNKVEQAFNLVGFGSFLTFYLSVLYRENPALIPYVDYFKKRLAEQK
jgi:glucose/mannose-6-phosphate isomerase